MVHKKTILKSLFALFFVVFFLKTAEAQSLEGYCQDGYYKLPNEPVCSRAPNCGGKSYDEVKALPMPNPQECMAKNEAGCRGWVPLCCYEVARTGDFTKCVGYWERLWCAPLLCEQARQNGATDAQCGGNCMCAHAYEHYCGNVPPVPLQDRLSGKYEYGALVNQVVTPTPTLIPTPTFTPTPPLSTPTSTPFPTPTKVKVFSTPTSTPIPLKNIPTSRPTQPVFPTSSKSIFPTIPWLTTRRFFLFNSIL
jgi:hypothetical protein